MQIVRDVFYTIECNEANEFIFKPNFSTLEKMFGYEFKSKFCNIVTNDICKLVDYINELKSEILKELYSRG